MKKLLCALLVLTIGGSFALQAYEDCCWRERKSCRSCKPRCKRHKCHRGCENGFNCDRILEEETDAPEVEVTTDTLGNGNAVVELEPATGVEVDASAGDTY